MQAPVLDKEMDGTRSVVSQVRSLHFQSAGQGHAVVVVVSSAVELVASQVGNLKNLQVVEL
jgi:hypothetical protein